MQRSGGERRVPGCGPSPPTPARGCTSSASDRAGAGRVFHCHEDGARALPSRLHRRAPRGAAERLTRDRRMWRYSTLPKALISSSSCGDSLLGRGQRDLAYGLRLTLNQAQRAVFRLPHRVPDSSNGIAIIDIGQSFGHGNARHGDGDLQ
jgi:hypothetical protein